MENRPKNFKCCSCGKELKQIHEDTTNCEDFYKNLLLDGGTCVVFTPNYGSKEDGVDFATILCDECIKKCVEL